MNAGDRHSTPGGQTPSLLPLPLAIISVGRDAALLKMRQEAIVSRASLHIWSGSPEQARFWSDSKERHLWVFCFTVEVQEVVYLAGRVRRFSPQSRLILMEDSRPPGPEAVLFNRVVRTRDGIDGFLDTLTVMATSP